MRAHLLCVVAYTLASASAFAQMEFNTTEKAAISRHGPWPPAISHDPGNRLSGKPAAIAFGERLFFDPRLSAGGTLSCASCHLPEKSWTDGLPRSAGATMLDRNAPSIVNTRFERWLGRDGSSDSLWSHAIRPLTDTRELAMTPALLAERIRGDKALACEYRKATGNPPGSDDELLLVNVGKALAAFQETIVSGRTPFDEFRDALQRDDRNTMARYPESAQRGLKIFIGRGNCSVCHFGPRFTNGEFADIGIPFFAAPGHVDSGRHAGVKQVTTTRFNLLGPYNDDKTRANAVATRHLTLEHRHWGEFKVPGLRNVALTAPYMHAGSLASLTDVVKHYSDLNEDRLHADGERILKPLKLSEDETADLVAFLETLSESRSTTSLGRNRKAANCR